MYELNLGIKKYGIYDLFPITDFRDNKSVKNELEKITDFEHRLIYYNKNVKSLSIYFHEVQIDYEWHYDKPKIKIYCNSKNFEAEKDFPEQEKIFLRLRAKEVKRIIKELEKAPTYKDKLQFIFSVKGYYPDRVPEIYPNMAKTEPLYLAKAIIDLHPTNEAERTIYNEFVIAEFNKIAKDENGFTKHYFGFDFEKEKKRLDTTLKKSFDRERLLNLIKNKIEKRFNYPECLDIEEKEKNKHIIKDINKNIDSRTICRNIFTKLVLGIPIDINRIVLDTQEFKDYTHYTEIFKFYRYVNDLIDKPETFQKDIKENILAKIERQPQPETLKITTSDKLLNELNIIESVFKAQFLKYDEVKNYPCPFISDKDGKDGIDGRYIASFDFYSNVELFNIQLYKDEFTKRFENSNNTTLLKNQLLEIHGKAIEIRDYYNDSLTNDCKIRTDYLITQQLSFEQAHEKFIEHCACIEVSDYHLKNIYFGESSGKYIEEWLFHYNGDNSLLASICQSVIDFIDKFNLEVIGQAKYLIPNDNMIHEILETPRMKNMIAINDFVSISNGINSDERKQFDPLKRDAGTNGDFETIYQRELNLFNANDGTAFKKWLNKKVNDLLTYEQALPANESVQTSKAQDVCFRFLEWVQTKEITVKEVSNPVKALFCFYINEAEIIKKGESENLETYCKRVCEKYNLKYAVRVNKGFYNSESEGNLLLIKEIILPGLEKVTKKKLSEHLEKKLFIKKEKKAVFS